MSLQQISVLKAQQGFTAYERSAALFVAFVIAIRYRFPPDIPLGFLVAVMILPITFRYLQRFHGATLIMCLTIVAALSGAALTFIAEAPETYNQALLFVYTWRVLGLALVLSAFLWVRQVVGIRLLVLMFALGSFVTIGVNGINFDNPWKFTFSVPTILLVLSLASIYGKRVPQSLALTALAGISALNDSRSAAAMLIIAAAIVFTQTERADGSVSYKKRAIRISARMIAIGVGGYFLVQAAILDGMLGEGAQARTEMQIQQSGSALVGGRPEMGAAIALLAKRPWGYGSGTLASYDYINTGKQGMAALGYDPNNGYVEQYMFGNGLEVHSLIGDLWLSYGVAGLLLAVAIAGYLIFGTVHAMARNAASGVLMYLVLRSVWDLAFSPYASAMVTLPLVIAIALPIRETLTSHRISLPWQSRQRRSLRIPRS